MFIQQQLLGMWDYAVYCTSPRWSKNNSSIGEKARFLIYTFWCTQVMYTRPLCHIYGIVVTYYINPWNLHLNVHFSLVYLDVLLTALFIREESGAFALGHYLCRGISLDPSWPTVYAKKRQFVTCLKGSWFIPCVSILPACPVWRGSSLDWSPCGLAGPGVNT